MEFIKGLTLTPRNNLRAAELTMPPHNLSRVRAVEQVIREAAAKTVARKFAPVESVNK